MLFNSLSNRFEIFLIYIVYNMCNMCNIYNTKKEGLNALGL